MHQTIHFWNPYDKTNNRSIFQYLTHAYPSRSMAAILEMPQYVAYLKNVAYGFIKLSSKSQQFWHFVLSCPTMWNCTYTHFFILWVYDISYNSHLFIFLQVYVLKRPHVDEFLQRMGELYECVLFTASLAKVRFFVDIVCFRFHQFIECTIE